MHYSLKKESFNSLHYFSSNRLLKLPNSNIYRNYHAPREEREDFYRYSNYKRLLENYSTEFNDSFFKLKNIFLTRCRTNFSSLSLQSSP